MNDVLRLIATMSMVWAVCCPTGGSGVKISKADSPAGKLITRERRLVSSKDQRRGESTGTGLSPSCLVVRRRKRPRASSRSDMTPCGVHNLRFLHQQPHYTLRPRTSYLFLHSDSFKHISFFSPLVQFPFISLFEFLSFLGKSAMFYRFRLYSYQTSSIACVYVYVCVCVCVCGCVCINVCSQVDKILEKITYMEWIISVESRKSRFSPSGP